MSNKYGIPGEDLEKIRVRDKTCVYCHKTMVKPSAGGRRSDWASIEHLNYNGPFYWKDNLKLADIVICCISCNASRSNKKLPDWFKSPYCIERHIDEKAVVEPVKKYLRTPGSRT